MATRRIVPRGDLEGSIGSGEKRWEKAYIGNVSVVYDTVADMKADLELREGSAARTKGYSSINDSNDGFYSIREKQVSDVEDGITIIFLDNGNVAERISTKDNFYFDTVAEMKTNTNLLAGQTVQTKGYNSANDGDAAAYLIRGAVSGETYDNEHTILLDNGNVAEWISQNNYLSYKDSNYTETYDTPVFKSYHQASVEWEAQKELDAAENTLTVATYNTENECDQRCIGDISNIPLSKRLTVALMTKAQVIGFNESLNGGDVDAMDMYSNLGKFTDGIFAPINPNVEGGPYTYGNMIQSALPLDSKTYALYPHVSNVEDRGYAKVVFTLGGKTISVYATHLGLNTTERSPQISSLFNTVQADTSDYKIVIGDMNTDNLSELQAFVDAGYTFVNSGQYPTYFHSNAIDHIICSPGISIIESGYIEDTLVPNTLNLGRYSKNAVSDHSPLWARLRFN